MKMSVRHIRIVIGTALPLIVWVAVKYAFGIEDRFLPDPRSVISAFVEIRPHIFVHASYSLLRLVIGYVCGCALGIATGILFYKSRGLCALAYPTFQSLRSIPPYATVPFFLLWFGFSEWGKFAIILFGISFNLAVASFQALAGIDEKYHTFFKSVNKRAKDYVMAFTLPCVAESILPTLRFSLSTAIGLVVVAEMLGAQTGLGRVIQTSKSTFSMNVIFLAAFLFGIVNFLVDHLLVLLWKRIVFWKNF